MSNKVKIAIASTDGKVVNEHFGRADFFSICEIDSDGWKYVERRHIKRLCNKGEHSEGGILSTVDTLKDCTAVVVSKIGVPAKRELTANGISVFELQDFIDDVMSKLTAYYGESPTLPPGT